MIQVIYIHSFYNPSFQNHFILKSHKAYLLL